ncbi:MAG: phosphoribosylamine--glycine ligase [Muribaculaceae bacterium]|nr:phosphoribosylamine--glycine ligase [Muribaculaceae bacterium]
MKDKRVLVIGSGGRCHAIIDALSRSNRVGKIYCAPGNGGIASQAEILPVPVTDTAALADFAETNNIDMTIVGPEAALAAGIVDEFQNRGLRIFGPTMSATRIESSKEFAKKLMAKYGVPTGDYKVFSDFHQAREYVLSHSLPTVIKYDGLAAGKGVVVATTYEEAENALRDMLLDATFGDASVLIEEFLDGPEFSFMCLVNGHKVYPLATAQDHKRAYEGDKGPNTGGMGAYSPVPFVTPEIREYALKEIMQRTADAMCEEGVPFTGVLYGGLIQTVDGPKVIEFNARFGDPETEVVLPRLESDIYDLFEAVLDGKEFTTEWSDDATLGIVMAAEGYPGKYAKGMPIKGLDSTSATVYHMGTSVKDGEFQSAGGRVLMVVGRGETLAAAREKALAAIEHIEAPGLFYRRDIGHQSIKN